LVTNSPATRLFIFLAAEAKRGTFSSKKEWTALVVLIQNKNIIVLKRNMLKNRFNLAIDMKPHSHFFYLKRNMLKNRLNLTIDMKPH
jgi:hypothetical protein